MTIEISVVVCTRNRIRQLDKCLRSFERLQYNKAWELIIIDNGSSDGTWEYLNNLKKTTHLPLVINIEKYPGLSAARNKGISTSTGKVIAFTDDDCYPYEDYLTELERALQDETLGFVGGRVLLHNPDDLPITIQTKDTARRFRAKDYIEAGAVHGANFAFRRQTLIEIGGFDVMLGAGTRFPCEDVDALAEVLLSGWDGLYDPRIVVSHDHGRKTLREGRSLQASYDRGRGAYFAKRILLHGPRAVYAKHYFYKIRNQRLSITFREVYSGIQFILSRAKNKPKNNKGNFKN